MTTAFTFTPVEVLPGLSFYIDGNSKITWDNGTYTAPAPNALSLPHIACCPGSTERCRTSCYVHGLRKNAPEMYRHYELNELALHASLLTPTRRALSAGKLAAWIATNARGGFRWHVSGDVISLLHAEWIVDVCEHTPGVNHWIYTRTLAAVSRLAVARNLAVNVSVDRHNWTEARDLRLASSYGARLCYLVSEPDEEIPPLPPGSVIFPDYPLRGRGLPEPTEVPWWQLLRQDQRRQVCPADFFGQSEQHRCGPCTKCLYPASETPRSGAV